MRKRTPKKNNGLKSSNQGNKKLNEKPDAKCNKWNNVLRASPHPAELPACEKKLKISFSSEENHQREKIYANVIEVGARHSPIKQLWPCNSGGRVKDIRTIL